MPFVIPVQTSLPNFPEVAPESLYPKEETMAKSLMSVDSANEISQELRNEQSRLVRSFTDTKVSAFTWDLRHGYRNLAGERVYVDEKILQENVYTAKLIAYKMQSTLSDYAGDMRVDVLRTRLEEIWTNCARLVDDERKAPLNTKEEEAPSGLTLVEA